jgi:hypothetical protein
VHVSVHIGLGSGTPCLNSQGLSHERAIRIVKRLFLISCGLLLGAVAIAWYYLAEREPSAAPPTARHFRDPGHTVARTSFQTGAPWHPSLQLGCDVAICYGADSAFPGRLALWKAQSYAPEWMTGASWGHYEDYLEGRFDGTRHWDDVQTGADGKAAFRHRGIPYVSPSDHYSKEQLPSTRRISHIVAQPPEIKCQALERHVSGSVTRSCDAR